MDKKERIKNYHCMVMQAELFTNLCLHVSHVMNIQKASLRTSWIYKLVQSEDH